jgi:hypothetical protein
MRRLVPLLFAASLALPAVCGKPKGMEIQDLETPVRQGSKVTYRDLVASVFKGVRQDGSGSWVTAEEKVLRRVGEKERTIVPAGTPLSAFRTVPVRGDGTTYLLMVCEAEGSFSETPASGAFVLAAFPEGGAEPTDVADMAADRFTGLAMESAPALGPDDSFAIANSHHNSNQGYLITDLFHIRGGRIRKIVSVFTLSLNGMCEKSFREEVTFQAEEDPGLPYPKVNATVTLEKGPSEVERDSCPRSKRVLRREVYRGTCRWDKAKGRYGPPDKGLAKIERFNDRNL